MVNSVRVKTLRFILTVGLAALAVEALSNRAECQSNGDSSSVAKEDSTKNNLVVLPAVFYTPETELGFGLYPGYIFRISPKCKPSYITVLAFYTVKKQVSISLTPNIYFMNNLYILSGDFSYNKWPNAFYGFGTGASKDDYEEFTTRGSSVSLNMQREFAENFYLGAGYEMENRKYLEIEPDGLLASGDILGSKNSAVSGIDISATWDGRDNVFYPAKGGYVSVQGRFFDYATGGDYLFDKYSVDLRKYFTLPGGNTAAIQAYAEFTQGKPPFWYLPQIGSVVRGYLPQLYIEKELMAVQAEYRHQPLWKNFGFVLFAGIGTVADKISNLQNSSPKFAAGFGIRYMLVKSEKLNIRIDYGIGNGSAELYLAAAEAF